MTQSRNQIRTRVSLRNYSACKETFKKAELNKSQIEATVCLLNTVPSSGSTLGEF